MREGEVGAESGMNAGSVEFRDVDVNADGIDLRKIKQLLSRAAVTGVDEVADVYVAACDNAAERRVNAFEGFEILQATDVGFRRILRGGFGSKVAVGVVDFLFRDGIALQ